MAAVIGKENLVFYSLFYYLKDELNTNWGSSIVDKKYPDEDADLPRICLSYVQTLHTPLEMGSMSTIKDFDFILEVFGEYSGQNIDIASEIRGLMESTINLIDFNTAFPYLEDDSTNPAYDATAQKIGSFTITDIDIRQIDLGDKVEEIDKYRTNIYLTIRED